MKKLLITGGAGFIGSNFIQYLLNERSDVEILALDKLTYAGNLSNLGEFFEHPNFDFQHGDICDRNKIADVFINFNPDFVFNFAAESHVDRSILEPDVFVQTNIVGTHVLLEEAKKSWTDKNGKMLQNKRFIQISTDEVYGSLDSDEPAFKENTPIDPHSPYSASKASADMLVKSYYDTYGLPINITRCSNNYGPYQFPEKLIPLIIHNAINLKPLPIYGDGQNVRDWLHVVDHCKAIENVAFNGESGEVFNVGGMNEWTNIELVNTIIDILNVKVSSEITRDLIHFVTDRKGHDRRYGIDPTKIVDKLNWKHTVNFKEGLESVIDWYLANTEWMENIITKDYLEYYENNYKGRY